MKKFLALVLALVMTMSLVTVSAGAEDFTDAEDIQYEEAVAVISAIGVVNGYANGTFNPDGGLTRQAAAKIICNMILGPTTAAELHADTNPFPDVDKNSEFAGYIAYCAKEGIISGYADGTFKGANGLTGYAFAKMLLGALGYDATTEGYTGENWSVNVAKKFIGIGLNAGLKNDFNGVNYITREEAALYAFNTLKATMVEYNEQTTINVGGAEIVLAGAAQDLAWGVGTLNDGKVANDGFVQFGEKYFGKLTRVDDVDMFGRPANTWTYNKAEIGTFVDYTTFVVAYTTGVTGGDVYKTIGSAAADFDFIAWEDGVMSKTVEVAGDLQIAKNDKDDMTNTGNGVLTEIYVNVDEEEVTVVQINTYLATVTADYNKNKETVTVAIYDDDNTVTATKIFLEDVASIVDLKADDMILVNVANNVVVEVMEPTVIADAAITKYSTDVLPTYIVTGGEQIDAAAIFDATACDDKFEDYDKDALADYTYDVYMDQYGYVNGIFECTGTAKYVFLAGYDKSSSNLAVRTAEAFAIFTDGTAATIKVAFKDTNAKITAAQATAADGGFEYAGGLLTTDGDANRNEWFKYSEEDGVYTLTPVEKQLVVTYGETRPEMDTLNVESARVDDFASDEVAYGNDDSVYITVDTDATDIDGRTDDGIGIAEVDAVYTGVQEISLILDDNSPFAVTGTDAAGQTVDGDAVVYALYDSDLYITAAIVLGAPEDDTNTGYAYALKGAKNEYYADEYYYWDFEAVVAGVVKELTVKDNYKQVVIDTIQGAIAGYGTNQYGIPGLLKLTYDEDGYVVGAELMTDSHDYIYASTELAGTKKVDPDVYEAYMVYHKTVGKELTCVGRTLYTAEEVDIGLTLVAGAPVVVIQKDAEGNRSIEEYSNIAAALDSLEPTELFKGTIAAELNDKGTAEWIVISSAIQLKADTKDTTPVDGITVDVDTLLKTIDVTVTGTVADADQTRAIAAALAEAGYEYIGTSGTTVTAINTNSMAAIPVPFTII